MRNINFGILPAMIFLALFVQLINSENYEIPKVVMKYSRDSLFMGSEFILTLQINYPNANEISIITPGFPESFFLDRSISSSRFLHVSDPGHKWTVVDYHFVIGKPGSYIIDPFIIITPAGRISTETITLTVHTQELNSIMPGPMVSWEHIPTKAYVGQSININLLINNQDPAPLMPDPQLIFPELIENFIIEQEKAETVSGSSDFIIRFKITPLAIKDFNIPGRSIIHNNIFYEIPALQIHVYPLLDQPDEKAILREEIKLLPHPDFPPLTMFLPDFISIKQFRKDYESRYLTAKDLYESGFYAETLTLLRSNERERIAFSAYALLRQQTEKIMGLNDTQSEIPRKMILGIFFLILSLTVILFLILSFKKADRKFKIALSVIFAVICAGVLVFYFYGTWALDLPYIGPFCPAVLKDTELRNVPDFSGEAIYLLKAGQPVQVYKPLNSKINKNLQDTWVWISTRDIEKYSGWVPEDRVIFLDK